MDDIGSSTFNYDILGLTAEFMPSTMTLGRGVFIVGAGASLEVVELGFQGSPGGGRVIDGFSNLSFSNATATVLVPEAGSAALMGLGLLALGLVGRHRQLRDDLRLAN